MTWLWADSKEKKLKKAIFGQKRVKMSVPGHGVNTKSVDNGLIYLNLDFQANPMTQIWENGQKPSKMAIFDTKC